MFNLFTYGTLLKGNPNQHYLSTSKLVGDGKLKDIELYDYVDPYHLCSLYPVAFFAEEGKGQELIGEVYECDDRLLPYLEQLEGTPTLYTRETVTVQLADGTERQCFVYIGNMVTWVSCDTLIPYDMDSKYRLYKYELDNSENNA